MAGIGIEQTARGEVEHTHEEGDEHEGVVALAHGAVDGFDDELWRGVGHRGTAEHAACHSHHQGGRHTLACHVADAEIELLVADEEVEEVATHLLGRHHLAEDVDVCALRERRIDLRQHLLLDVAGNLQFLLHRHIRGRRVLQFLHVVRQRGLHVLKGIAQAVHLTGLHLRQLDAEMSLRHLTGCCDETCQRAHILLDHVMAQQIDDHQTCEEYGEDDVDQHVSVVMDDGLRHNDHHRPLGVFHKRVEHPRVDVAVHELKSAALAVHHLSGHHVIKRVGGQGCDILEFLPQHLVLIGMDQVGAIDVDDEGVRLVLEVFLETFVVLGIQALMPLPEPFQRHVCSQHTDLTALIIVDMGHVGGSELL